MTGRSLGVSPREWSTSSVSRCKWNTSKTLEMYADTDAHSPPPGSNLPIESMMPPYIPETTPSTESNLR